jgi:hypothetical protein
MTKNKNPTGSSDEQVRTLLERYKCPVPFHEVRTRFLGNIATPVVSAPPIKMVEDLWGGELPAFDSIDDANELIGALIMGLWNRLTRHQDRTSPFRLTRIDSASTREGIAALALIRRQDSTVLSKGFSDKRIRSTCRSAPIVVSMSLANCARYLWQQLKSALTRPRRRPARTWRRRSGTCAR